MTAQETDIEDFNSEEIGEDATGEDDRNGSHGRRGRRGRGERGERGHGGSRSSKRGGPRGAGRHRSRRHNRGDVRAALLVLIAAEPRHGYELMQEIGERTAGSWQPSPGSVYPALAQLQDEGLIRVDTDESGRGIATLTAAGETYFAEHGEELERVWDAVKDQTTDGQRDLSIRFKGLVMAYRQVKAVGTAEQLQAASKVIDEAQRGLYAVLAQAPTDGADADDTDDTDA